MVPYGRCQFLKVLLDYESYIFSGLCWSFSRHWLTNPFCRSESELKQYWVTLALCRPHVGIRHCRHFRDIQGSSMCADWGLGADELCLSFELACFLDSQTPPQQVCAVTLKNNIVLAILMFCYFLKLAFKLKLHLGKMWVWIWLKNFLSEELIFEITKKQNKTKHNNTISGEGFNSSFWLWVVNFS